MATDLNQKPPHPLAGPFAVSRCSTVRRYSATPHSAGADTRLHVRRGGGLPRSPGASRGIGRRAQPRPHGPAQERGDGSATGRTTALWSFPRCMRGRRGAPQHRRCQHVGPRRAEQGENHQTPWFPPRTPPSGLAPGQGSCSAWRPGGDGGRGHSDKPMHEPWLSCGGTGRTRQLREGGAAILHRRHEGPGER